MSLSRDEAVRLMAVYEAVGATLGPVFDARGVADEAERKRVEDAHGQLVMFIYEHCMRPVIRQYPDLDPDDIKPFLPKS